MTMRRRYAESIPVARAVEHVGYVEIARPVFPLPTAEQAREQGQVAVALGAGLVAFGLLVLLLLPKP